MKRHFHLRIKRSYYIPLFTILLIISFASIMFMFSFSRKPNITSPDENPIQNDEKNQINQKHERYTENYEQKNPNKDQNNNRNIQINKIDKRLTTNNKYRYSHLLIDSISDTTQCYNRSKNHLDLLIPFGLDPTKHHPNDKYVLVLGSGGLIGSALEPILRQHGYKTLHVLSRHHLDLRINASLDIFKGIDIAFVFFLAYEVGGAKFLQRPELQDRILEYNIQITNNVFTWLKKNQIRYAFASSSLSADKSNYGYVKRMGENITLKMPHLGRVFRLWNAYGFEYPGPKSHAIPDFVFQCLIRKKVKMLTNGQELRQFTHVNDISEALIAIMENFDETPQEVDISDGNWLTLADTAKSAQKAVDGCELEIPEKAAKVQKRHEANLTSKWHQTKWNQKLKLDEGVQNIVTKMSDFINRSVTGSAVTFIINCGDEINNSIINNLEFIISRIDEMNSVLSPMRVEIIAASKSINIDIINDVPPCTILINKGHYLRKAVKFAHSNPIVIMDYNVLPTMEHMYFFQREIPRDLIFYFSEKQKVDKMNDAKGETIPSLATFQIVNDCNIKNISIPDDLSFIVASKETWLSVKVPPLNVRIHDWLMRLRCGYISIKFESPVWTWGNSVNNRDFKSVDEDFCCKGIMEIKQPKSGDTFIHYGKRKLIQ